MPPFLIQALVNSKRFVDLVMIDLNNKVVLITGATGALGQATAHIFSHANTKLVLTGRNLNKLNLLSDQLFECTNVFKDCDLCDEEEVHHLVQFAFDQFGRIDVLLNIAGGFAMGPKVHELKHEDFNIMFEMNFSSTLNTCKAVIPHMINQGEGRIINISARAATEGKGKMAPYCIAKSAVVTLTESLAAEHKHNNININCILPGTINTESNRTDMPDADHSMWVAPEDIANSMLYLSSNLSNAINGAIIPVYGKS